MIDTKFGSSLGRWCPNEVHGLYGVELWKNIMTGWGVFSSHTRFEVGDVSKIRFWHDL